MKSLHFKVLEIVGNKQYIFSSQKFKECSNRYINYKTESTGVKAKKKDLWERLAKETNMTIDSIHAWHAGNNGPGDISYVKTMAKVLEIDYKELLDEVKDEKSNMDRITYENKKDFERNYTEKELIIKVYQLILEQDRKAERRDYVDFFDDVTEFLSNHALEMSKDTHRKLGNILIEYHSHILQDGCDRWHAISEKYGFDCWRASELYRNQDWLDGEDIDEWKDMIWQFIEDEMEVSYTIGFENGNGWASAYLGDPNDKEALIEKAKQMEGYDGSKVTAEPENTNIAETISRVFDEKHMYYWLFTRMLTDVFRYDFPEYFT